MPKTSIILVLTTIITSLLTSFTACKKSEYEILKSELQKDLKWFNYDLHPHHYFEAGLNIDSFANETEKKLIKLLTYKESLNLNIKELPNVELIYFADSLKKIYSFYYSTSSSKGMIATLSIIQWKNKKDSILAIPITKQLYFGRVDKFYRLKPQSNNLYMVSASNWTDEINYVLQFEENGIKFDYPAFFNRPYLIVDGSKLYDYEKNGFNEKTKTFSINCNDTENVIRDYASEDKPIAATLNTMMKYTGLLQLKFNGKNFDMVQNN